MKWLGKRTRREMVRRQVRLAGTEPLEQRWLLAAAPVLGNEPPMLGLIPDATTQPGQLLTFTATATDGDNNGPLVFQLDPNETPVGASIDRTTGVFTWTPTAAQVGTFNLVVIVSDRGTRPVSDAQVVKVTVQGANQAPVNTVPGSQFTSLNAPLVFSQANANPISVADADAGTNPLQVTLSSTNGTLTLAGTAGLTFSTGDGSGDATMTFTGAQTAINTALNGLSFTPTNNFSGNAELTITTNDQGNSGSGGALSDTDTVAIVVASGNQAPVNTVPGAQSVNEDTTLVFSTAGGNAISVSDADAGTNPLRVSLSVTNGLLTLAGTSGLTFSIGDGSGDSAMTFTGSQSAINTALAGMSFQPTPNFGGSAELTITTNDQGNTGAGGPQSDTDTVAITVNALNDAPVLTVPGAQNIPVNTTLTFSTAAGRAITLADVDAGTNPVRLSLTASNGTVTLASLTGLTFITGDGTADADMVFEGTLASLNAAVDGLVFTPTNDFIGAASLAIVVDDRGNTGAGGAQSDSDSIAITVQGINQAPVNTIPAAQTTPEDVPLIFASGNGNAIQVADPDAGVNPIQVTLSVTNGTLSLSGVQGLTFTTGDGTADTTMTFTGTVAAINLALAGMSFVPTLDFHGDAQLNITTNDQGNSGIGGALSDSDTLAITVTEVNDAPIVTVPGPQATQQNTPLVLGSASGAVISIADVDNSGGQERLTISATNGVLTLAQTTGLTFAAGDGTADALIEVTGTLANINAALDGLIFTPDNNFSGTATVTVTANDQGNTGAGGAKSDTKSFNIGVNQVNQPPVNTVPAGPVTAESATDRAVLGISIADADAAAGNVQVTLSVTNGTLSLSTAVVGGIGSGQITSGNGTGTVVVTAPLAAINATLAAGNGLIYRSNAGFTGSDTLTITSNDQGNTGTGGPQSDTDTLGINVIPANQPPSFTDPASQSGAVGNLFEFQLQATDPDAGQTLTYQIDSVVTQPPGTNNSSQATINPSTGLFSWTPDTPGTYVFLITVTDNGLTPLADSTQLTVVVTGVNEAPVNTAPATASTPQNTALVFNTANANAISVADPDAGTGAIQITLAAVEGTVTLSGVTGLTFTVGDGTADDAMTFTGTLTDINAALNGLSFNPTTDFTGDASLTITSNDQGNTGSGGAKSDSDTIAITVTTPVTNQAPVNTVPGTQTTAEDTALVFSSAAGNAISIADPDAGTGALQVTLTATAGKLTLAGLTGLTFTAGDGTDDASMTFTGTLADINAALNGMSFAPDLDFNGSASVTILTDDQGNTGTGGALSDSDSVSITVTAVNDAPTIAAPAAQTTDEDTSLVFSVANANSISLADLDAGAASLAVTLTAANGALTLASLTGLTFTTGDGTADATMPFTGTLADINAALDGLTFAPTADFNGTATLAIEANDQGNTGSGGPLIASQNVSITVNSVNDSPLFNTLGDQAGTVGTPVSITAGATDLDGNQLTYQLDSVIEQPATVNNSGTATIDPNTGAINWTPDTPGLYRFLLAVTDDGNPPLADTVILTVVVVAANQPPVNTVPGPQAILEDQVLVFTEAGGNGISIADADAGSQPVQVTLTATLGAVTLSGVAGLTFTAGDGTADATMTFSGTIADINAALAGASFIPTADEVGAGGLTVATDDLGNSGGGGPKTDSDAIEINIAAINDAPSFTAGPNQSVNQGAPQQTVTGWATNIVAGPTNESSQALTFDVQVDAPSLFDVLPAIAADGTLTYTPSASATGVANVQVTLIDDGGTANGGVNQSLPQAFTITVNAVAANQPPVNSVPATQTTDNGVSLTFAAASANAISVTDPDVGADTLQVSLSVTNGALSLSGVNGLTFTVGDGADDAAMTFTGTVTDVNAALEGLVYTPAVSFTGADTLTIVTNDLGHTGSGGALSDTDAVTINVLADNQAPVITVPGQQQMQEDGAPLVFSTADGNAISIADADAGTQTVEVTLGASAGSLTLAALTGLTFSAGDGTADATMTFTGTLTDVNAALNGLAYTPASNDFGFKSLAISVSDLGHTGAGGAQVDSDTVNIAVLPVNDAPVNALPAAQTTLVNTPLTLSTAAGNAITIGDVDAAASQVQLTLTVTNASLTLATLTGLAFSVGDGTTDATMTFTGTLTDINAALDGLVVTPVTDFTGLAQLTVLSEDLGFSGSGGNLTDSDVLDITVQAAENQPPVNTVPAGPVTAELTVSQPITGLSVADPDAGSADIQVTLSVLGGALTIRSDVAGGLAAGDIAGNGTASVTLTGSLTAINATLAAFNGVLYLSGAVAPAGDTLTMLSDDLGNTGTGGSKTDSDALTIDIVAGTGVISGRVYNATATDGVPDPGTQFGLPGWTVFLDLNGNNSLDSGEPSTVSDATGDYSFSGLVAGNYQVRTVPPTGFNVSAPEYFFFMNGAQVSTPVETTASGFGALAVDTSVNALVFKVAFSGATGTTQALAIRSGASGTDGAVLYDLAAAASVGAGFASPVEGITVLNPADVATFDAGNAYVELRTSDFPSGQLRGQILPGVVNAVSLGRGNTADTRDFFAVDTQAPFFQLTSGLANDTGASANDGITNDPSIAGNVTDNVGVVLLRAGFENLTPENYANITVALQPNGDFSLMPSTLEAVFGGPLTQGTHTLTLLATDAAGFVTQRDISFRLDSQTNLSGGLASQYQTSTAAPPDPDETLFPTAVITGSAEPGVVVTLDGTSLSALADNAGLFTIAGVPLALGANTLTLGYTDLAGNIASTDITLTRVAEQAPANLTMALAIDSGASSTDRWTNNPAINATLTNPGDFTTLSLGVARGSLSGSSSVPLGTGSYAFSAADLATALGATLDDGAYRVTLIAAGGVGSPVTAEFVFSLDTTAPAPPAFGLAPAFIPDPGNPDETTSEVVTLVGTAEPGVVLSLVGTLLTQTADASGNFSFTGITLILGLNQPTIVATDLAGNTSQTTVDITRLSPPVPPGPENSSLLAIDSVFDNLDDTLDQDFGF